MKADIIVPTFENTELTLRCFESVRRHTDGYNLVWVDNGSSAESRSAVMSEIVRHPHHRTLWFRENIGFIKANNVALRLVVQLWNTPTSHVVLLNNDVEVTHGWLDRLVKVASAEPRVGVVGPVTSECKSWQSFEHVHEVIDMFQVPDDFVERDTEGRARRLAYCYGELFRKCNMVAFFCALVHKDVFRAVGYLDEVYDVGLGDDDDLCKRATDVGFSCVISLGTYVRHAHRQTFKNLYSDGDLARMKANRHQVFFDKHGEKATVHEVH